MLEALKFFPCGSVFFFIFIVYIYVCWLDVFTFITFVGGLLYFFACLCLSIA